LRMSKRSIFLLIFHLIFEIKWKKQKIL